MIIHVRLRPEVDGDISAWYEAQTDKSDCVRKAIRSYIERDGTSDAAALFEMVQVALGDLQGMVRAAVREALSSYQLTAAPQAQGSAEDPELAARLDAGLDQFFGEE